SRAYNAAITHTPLLALDPVGLAELLDRAEEIEHGFMEVLRTSTFAISNPEDPSARGAFTAAALNAGIRLNGLFGVDEDGRFVIVSEPPSVFDSRRDEDETRSALLAMPLDDDDDHQLALTVAQELFPLAEATIYQ